MLEPTSKEADKVNTIHDSYKLLLCRAFGDTKIAILTSAVSKIYLATDRHLNGYTKFPHFWAMASRT